MPIVSSALTLIKMWWWSAKCWYCLLDYFRHWFLHSRIDVADAVVDAKQIAGIPSAFDLQQLGVLTAPLRLRGIALEVIGLR